MKIIQSPIKSLIQPVCQLATEAIVAGFNPSSFFLLADDGFIFDYNDPSTIFQDSARTIAGVLEQPVGGVTDKSGKGRHGSQPTDAARPIWCARLNQHLKSEDLTDAVWTKTGTTITANGFGNLDKIVEDVSAGNHRVSGLSLTASAGMTFVQSFRVAPAERTRCIVTFSNTTPWSGGVAPVADFSLVGSGTVNSATGGTATITALGDGSYRLTFAIVPVGAGNFVCRFGLHNGTSSNYTGDGSSGMYMGEDQLELGTVFTKYQSIDTATVYDQDLFFKRYLRFDSTTMWLQVTLGAELTSGTILHVGMVENATGTIYGPNTVNITTNSGFGLADSVATPSVQGVSGNGTTFHTPNSAASVPILPHVGLATASGAAVRSRYNLTAAVSADSVTSFNGATWRIGRTLNDAGNLTGRSYFDYVISKVLSSTDEEKLIRYAATKVHNIIS